MFTIQTHPSEVVAGLTLPQSFVDAGTAAGKLQTYANNIEAVMAGGKVSGASGSQILDQNGLLKDYVDFTVSYTPPGSSGLPLTIESDVPSSYLAAFGGLTEAGGLAAANVVIDASYQQLVGLAGSTSGGDVAE